MTLSRTSVWGTLIVLLGLGALAYLLWFRPPAKVEDQLKQRVVQMARAAEERNVGFIMQQASSRFRSQTGLNKDELRAFLLGQFFGAQWVRVFISDLEAHLTGGNSAEVSGHFVLGRSRAQSLKDLAKESTLGHYRIVLKAELEPDGQWRFVWADHRPIAFTD